MRAAAALALGVQNVGTKGVGNGAGWSLYTVLRYLLWAEKNMLGDGGPKRKARRDYRPRFAPG